MRKAGLKFEQIRDFPCDIHAGRFYRTRGASVRLRYEACCGTAVQYCEQRFIARLQSVGYGKVLWCAGDQVDFLKIGVQDFAEKLYFNLLLRNRTEVLPKVGSANFRKEVVMCHVAFVACVLGNGRNAVFNGLRIV